jgi:hypothetical protein
MRRSTDRALQQVADLSPQDGVGRQPDRVTHALAFEELVYLRVGKRRAAAEIVPFDRAPIADIHRLQHFPPAGDAVDGSGPQGAPLKIAELVEHEKRR